MQLNEFVALMKPLEDCTGKEFSGDQAKAYFSLLSDLSCESLAAAVARCLLEMEFPALPMPARLRKLAIEASQGQIAGWADRWKEVTKSIRCNGGWYAKDKILAGLDPLTRAAVEAVGLDSICNSENPGVQAAQFRQAYESLASREIDLRRLPEALRPKIAPPNAKFLTVASGDNGRLKIEVKPTTKETK